MTNLKEQAAAFARLHERRNGDILVLPNAWDALSARIIEAAGARAIATTSAGVAWALGFPDGQAVTRDEMMETVRRIVRVVRVPVTTDIESGYGDGGPDAVAETVVAAIGAGAVGINLEDSATAAASRGLIAVEPQKARIAAARRAAHAEGVPLFINARVDVYLRQVGAEETRFDETVLRARAYLAAGADGIFIPGILDAPLIGRFVKAIDAPLNVLANATAPSAADLRAQGVARASVGPHLTLSMMSHVRRVARDVLESGTFEPLRGDLSFVEANGWFSPSRG